MKEKYESLSAKLSQVRLLILESQDLLRATELEDAWTIREWNLLCDTADMLQGRIDDIDERVRTEDYL